MNLDLKTMLTATGCCILLTLLKLLFDWLVPTNMFSRHDFELIVGWIVICIGWGIYFLDRFKNR